MAIVTGDRYLDLLARFVEEHAGALLDGSLVLKLNPVGLYYVQTRLDALRELERLRTGAPVDYLRAYIADLGDHRALEQLSRVLSLLTSVKVVSVLPPPARDPSPVALSPFGRLKSLELRGCNLSTSASRGLLQLRPILEKLICHNSADALRHIFAERTVEIQDAQVWSRLTSVSCVFNAMLLMDDSLHLLPAVQSLDLSRNRFAKAANLHRCSKLKFLDLGFNHLRNISSLSQVKSQISKLVLRNNALVTVRGIETLTTLEALDLSYNMISNFNEIESVATLSSLGILLLEGNPIAVTSRYREEVFSFFADPSKVDLDGRKITRSESWTVSNIVSKRRKQRAVYGLYAPAENVTASQTGVPFTASEDLSQMASDTGANMPRGKRKTSRLASIQDPQLLQKSSGAEVGEQDGSPGFHVSSTYPRDVEDRRQDAADEGDQDGADVMQLMQRVEVLREEGSKAWLQELRVLLEENNSESGQQIFELSIENKKLMMDLKLREMRRRWSRRRRRRQRRAGEGLLNGQDKMGSPEAHMEEEELLKIWKHDSALDESSEISETVHSIEESLSYNDAGFQSGVNTTAASETAASPKMSGDSQLASDVENSSGLEPGRTVCEANGIRTADENIEPGFAYAADEEQTSMDESFGSWRVIDEMVESRITSGGLASPPHYHEDVLQKRQNLEEELLRLSFAFDSGRASSSSDSETSSNDNSPVIVSGSSRSEGSPKGSADLRRESLEFNSLDTGRKQPCQLSRTVDEQWRQAETTYMRSNGSDESISGGLDDENESHHKLLGEQHSSATHSWPTIPKEKVTEALRTGHLNPACTDDILANAGGGENQASSQKNTVRVKMKGKSRRVRRVVILDDDMTLDSKLHPKDAVTISELDTGDLEGRAAELSTTAESDPLSLVKTGAVRQDLIGATIVSPCQTSVFDTKTIAKAEKDQGIAVVEAGKAVSVPTQCDHSLLVRNGNLKDPVVEFFRMKIGDVEEAESCLQYLKCGCMRLWEDSPIERDILLLFSSKDKLYMLAESTKQPPCVRGANLVLHVLASHKMQDVKKVLVGLGLQALRVDIGHSASYLFVTRNVNTSREILDMLRRPTEGNSEPAFILESWEQRQLRMFEKLVLGGARANVRMYLMLLFCCGDSKDNLWVARSVFLTSHHIFLCIEDLANFGVPSESSIAPQNPYFILEASANIYDLSQVVAGFRDGRVTLNFEKIIGGCSSSSFDRRNVNAESRPQELNRYDVWKFKGVPEEMVFKLVTLLRASHMEVALHPLTVKSVL